MSIFLWKEAAPESSPVILLGIGVVLLPQVAFNALYSNTSVTANVAGWLPPPRLLQFIFETIRKKLEDDAF